jgi:hypothetical protein
LVKEKKLKKPGTTALGGSLQPGDYVNIASDLICAQRFKLLYQGTEPKDSNYCDSEVSPKIQIIVPGN